MFFVRCDDLADAAAVCVVAFFATVFLAVACSTLGALEAVLAVAEGLEASVVFFLVAAVVDGVVADFVVFCWGGGEAAWLVIDRRERAKKLVNSRGKKSGSRRIIEGPAYKRR